MDVAAGGQIHDGICAPADRPYHLVHFGGDIGCDGAVADIGVYLHQEIAPDRHGLGFRVVDVVGDDGTAACDFIPYKFGRHLIRDGSAPVLPVAGIFFHAFTPPIPSHGDIRTFRRADAPPPT